MADKLKKVSKAHVRYKLSDGTTVPGATTITGLLNKPFLITWANRLGLEGIDSTKYRDAAAEIGTLAHQMIQDYLQGAETDFSNYTKEQISLAENAVLSFFEWEKGHKIEPIICEIPLVSELHRFGGTVDCYCMLDGEPTLLDFKTGKAIYDEYFVQLAGYKNLLEEHDHPVKSCHILRVGRDETEGFEDRTVTNVDTYFEIFKSLLNVYYAKKKVGWN
jgi:hypothetical protein